MQGTLFVLCARKANLTPLIQDPYSVEGQALQRWTSVSVSCQMAALFARHVLGFSFPVDECIKPGSHSKTANSHLVTWFPSCGRQATSKPLPCQGSKWVNWNPHPRPWRRRTACGSASADPAPRLPEQSSAKAQGTTGHDFTARQISRKEKGHNAQDRVR